MNRNRDGKSAGDLGTGSAGLVSIEIAAAVNNHDVLEGCLKRSPDLREGRATLRTYEGYATAGAAYNQALAESDAEVLVLVHQDVYLPAGFLENLRQQLDQLSAIDAEWAVAGVIGLDDAGDLHGQTWSTGLGRRVGAPPARPVCVATMDEVLLVVRRAAGMSFDVDLPSFHLYATDIVHIARAQGLKSYVLDLAVVHHSRPVVGLDPGYRRAYRHMQKKWRASLPIPNLVCPITRSPLTLLLCDFRLRRLHRAGAGRPAQPLGDPSDIARKLGLEEAAAIDAGASEP